MSKKRGIKIYWNMHTKTDDINVSKRFSENNCFKGNIIMKEDGYFEGVLKSSREDEKDINDLVYGFIIDDNYNIYIINDNNSTVHILSFKNGTFSGIYLENGCYEFSYGECNVELLDIENTNGSEELKKIKDFKVNFIKEDKEFYREKVNDLKKQVLIYNGE